MTQPTTTELENGAAITVASQRRVEIAQARSDFRRRTRIALFGLVTSVAILGAGVVYLWKVESERNNDPVALRIRSPFRLQMPFSFEPSRTDGGLPGGPAGLPGPDGAAGIGAGDVSTVK